MFILGTDERKEKKNPFCDTLLTQQDSDEGPQVGSGKEGDSDEEEFDCEYLVSITVSYHFPHS